MFRRCYCAMHEAVTAVAVSKHPPGTFLGLAALSSLLQHTAVFVPSYKYFDAADTICIWARSELIKAGVLISSVA